MRNAALSMVAAVTLVLVSACGGSKGGSSQTPTSPSASGPGTIIITSTAISNQGGKVLVVAAIPEGQSTPIGRACIAITSNAFSAPATTMVEIAASSNPCDPASVTKSFPAGRYNVTSGIFVSGSQTPEKLTAQTVTVAGNVSASITGSLLSQ